MDRAREKAIKLLGKITKVEEKEDCYIFYNEDKEYDGVIVILKKNNKVISMTEYVMGIRK